MTLYPYHPALSVLLYGLFLLALAVRPTWQRRLLFVPLAAVMIFAIFCTTTGKPSQDIFIASSVTTFFILALDYLFITDIQHDLRITGQAPIISAPFWQRVKWSAYLLFSPRGVGWTHEPTASLPPPPRAQTRASFVVHQVKWACIHILLYDACLIYARTRPEFSISGPSWADVDWMNRVLSTFVYVTMTRAMLSFQFAVLSAFCVVLGGDPQRWPDLFSSPLDAYTIRKAWGRAWHQILRRTVSSPGKFISSKLGFKRGTNASAYIQLYVAFFLSGVLHYMGEHAMLRNWSGGAMAFFMKQAMVITLEDFIIWLGRRAGIRPTRFLKTLGLAWTWLWLAYTFPPWLDPMSKKGLVEESLNISIILGVWRGEWVPKWPQHGR
ncbi:hypothetical protein FISHEDRAFT_35445 [Fistulina hepatica ATCC 64428]|uniref:Wax synthase domain-containing protein n=1 Tax=Fistulina hepatica ATCC 64428 TaxID=1128425 RepID=A0A0D7AKN3_9AGAR|nr:hypothetical protein FISHEDRAFT_35445 [Fistulina hepatica ATCC 64428]